MKMNTEKIAALSSSNIFWRR